MIRRTILVVALLTVAACAASPPAQEMGAPEDVQPLAGVAPPPPWPEPPMVAARTFPTEDVDGTATASGVARGAVGGQLQASPAQIAPDPVQSAASAAVGFSRLASAGGRQEAAALNYQQRGRVPVDRERYPDADTNPVKLVSEHPFSTFSIDVDTASYAVVRRFLNEGTLPPRDAVRVEELVNYFDYDYPVPQTGDEPFAISTALMPTPWNPHTQLLHLGLTGYDLVPDERPRANLVFLIDVSGSMQSADKLPLVKQSLRVLTEQLDDADTVGIVVYAGAAGTVLEPTPGSQRPRILAALNRLRAGGSTAGGEGLRLAYAQAEQHFDDAAINRVILATDGDFNVGVTSDERLEDFVARKRGNGIYLSILGFGQGNYNDRLMQTIAQAGNGTAAYVDSLREARKVLHDEMASVLFPIANDVKLQVEFNPTRVAEYRLIGYETRLLSRQDFSNDAVDAGELGAGHGVTALYEITPPGSAGLVFEPSRYAGNDGASAATTAQDDELAFFRVRYKRPGETESRLLERPIRAGDAVTELAAAPQEARFAAAVAAFGQLLRGDPAAACDYDTVLTLAQGARGADQFGYRAEFIQLVRLAETVAALPALERPSGGRW